MQTKVLEMFATCRRLLFIAYALICMSRVAALKCYYCSSPTCDEPEDQLLQIQCESSDNFDSVCGSITTIDTNGTLHTFKSCAKSVKGITEDCQNRRNLLSRECVLCNAAFCRYSFTEPEATLCWTDLDASIIECNYCTTDLCNNLKNP